jgi:methylmalonyl-CoA mutase
MLAVDKFTTQSFEAAMDPKGAGSPGRRRRKLLNQWPAVQKACAGGTWVKIRDKGDPHRTHKSLSGTVIRKVALPYQDDGEVLQWLMLDNVPGSYPHTAGTSPSNAKARRPACSPARGDAFRANTRFKLLSEGMAASACPPAARSRCNAATDPRPDIGRSRQFRHVASPHWTT